MTLLTRLRELSDSSNSQSWVSVEIHELKVLLDVVEAAKHVFKANDGIGGCVDRKPAALGKLKENLAALDGETK